MHLELTLRYFVKFGTRNPTANFLLVKSEEVLELENTTRNLFRIVDRSYLPNQSQRKDNALPDYDRLAKVLDWNLESDRCCKEDSHQPLKNSFELAHKQNMQIMRCAKGKACNECTHEITGFAVVSCWHQTNHQ